MTTAASRPGGKLRGKFAGRGKVLPPNNNNKNSKDGNDNSSSNNPSSSTTTTATATTKATTTAAATKDGINHRDRSPKVTMEMIKSQRSKIKRHEVFDKLDQAEGIILDILNIAKDTTKGFQFLASSPSERFEAFIKSKSGEKQTSQNTAPTATAATSNANATATTDTTDKNDNDKNDKTNNDEKANTTINDKEKITERTEEEWKNQIRHNGKSYMNKLKQIHDLLIPHSNLVVNYGTISSLEENNANSSSTNTNTTTSNTTTATTTSQNSTIGTITNGITNNNNDNEKKRKKRNNMYASRLEMRLAIDKKNLMNDLVQLEKKIFEEEMKTLKSTLASKSNGNTIMDTAMDTVMDTATATVTNTSNAINNNNSDSQMIDGNSQKRKREE